MSRYINLKLHEAEQIVDILEKEIKTGNPWGLRQISNQFKASIQEEIDHRVYILGLKGINHDEYIT